MPHRAGLSSLLDPLETALVNLRFSTFGAIERPDNVVIVAIDDATLAVANPLGQGRQTLAEIIDAIAAAGASVVGVDILLTDTGSSSGDRALAAALGNRPTVIAAAGSFAPDPAGQGIPVVQDLLWPQPMFTDLSDVGIVNISTDHSGTPRHVPMAFMTSRGLQPSFVVQTAALFTGDTPSLSTTALTLGERVIPLDIGLQMPLRLAGPTGTVTTIPAMDILAESASMDLSGKVVILGVTATGLGDRFPTPFDPDLPGVEVMATAVSQLVGGDLLRRDDMVRRLDVVSAILLAMICVVPALLLPLSIGVPLAAGVLALWVAVVWLVFGLGIWLSAALPLASAGLPSALAGMLRYTYEKRRAARSDRAVSALKKFQSPALGDRITQDPDFLLVPETRNLVVSFVDLTGFTQISQDLGPEDSEAFLKKFHIFLEQTVESRDGIVLNFMGDGALLVFGMFEPSGNPADKALQAAIAMARQIHALGTAEGFARPLSCRIGLHWGAVVLSRLGGDLQQQLTITGDSVNLCSRLLEVAKSESATIAATSDFIACLSEPLPLPVNHSATHSVRGRHGDVRLSFWLL
ncbi:adenylate/guanylate cyclase domain-containing protein [Sedimentitalea sp. JM2-8]|uniref:Adenylate/guanylate cyclase domain-containing protein n=1 Tax=Sedimentitalea xiamensis TaxID=3050037 RepID=A0ABT7FHQ7_9RHOB|nr:adenylate/guanylate cyclase domain-containing protein [Sedimentitalea xiamensis]MDK3074324.1 adenylate/guanylate cyclase domain-containing protein [Sedimentitalea xiamensis]